MVNSANEAYIQAVVLLFRVWKIKWQTAQYSYQLVLDSQLVHQDIFYRFKYNDYNELMPSTHTTPKNEPFLCFQKEWRNVLRKNHVLHQGHHAMYAYPAS